LRARAAQAGADKPRGAAKRRPARRFVVDLAFYFAAV
jgi:hypothetical protein